jgi:WD40 repeat protein
VGFVSCSNDELVKLWDLSGKLIKTFKGHGGFVFTVTCLAGG